MIRIPNWDKHSGKIVVEQNGKEWEMNLYAYGTCNCFLCTVYEYEDPEDKSTREQLQWFFMDEEHGKIMLGLKKASDGSKENHMDPVRKLTLYKKNCTDWQNIMILFARAFDGINIEIRSEEE